MSKASKFGLEMIENRLVLRKNTVENRPQHVLMRSLQRGTSEGVEVVGHSTRLRIRFLLRQVSLEIFRKGALSTTRLPYDV
jgi:hypothetical protein